MTKISIGLAVLLLVVAPMYVSAHGGTLYEIGGVEYEFVVGSLGEPVIVDDKTGVDLEIVRAGEPLVGAQENLKVELQAGSQSRVLELSPVYGAEGRYKANFIATVATTLTYRIFGELEGVPVDLSFTCNPAGHPQAEEMTDRVEISPGVVQVHKSGAFGCPQEKGAFGFPEPAPAAVGIAGNMNALRDDVAAARSAAQDSRMIGFAGVGVGFLALVVILVLHRRKRQPLV